MRALTIAILSLTAGPALAQQPKGDVFPPKLDGVEYILRYGNAPRPGWHDGLKYSDKTKAECERRLASMEPPSVCMVREQLDI
ncbi:hypothetical protein [Bradyrhizobium sp. MOS002]|uniref:hypothetical protein n=1 Tax=Bradyrhizobium sp. MOS002 TaxID=2133947 RepID=UPI000D11F230|nr:hypothetical protein [Bradyrhizobium sp. MOS002]PSO29826.1 hypothetical protein C7G41_24080 [Bradyrhizobium sp. MOS002]